MDKKSIMLFGRKKMNKRAIAFPMIALFVVLGLFALYLVTYLPLPVFTRIRSTINYYSLIIVWILLQAVVIYAYFKAGTYVIKGVGFIKSNILKGSYNLEKYIISHY